MYSLILSSLFLIFILVKILHINFHAVILGNFTHFFHLLRAASICLHSILPSHLAYYLSLIAYFLSTISFFNQFVDQVTLVRWLSPLKFFSILLLIKNSEKIIVLSDGQILFFLDLYLVNFFKSHGILFFVAILLLFLFSLYFTELCVEKDLFIMFCRIGVGTHNFFFFFCLCHLLIFIVVLENNFIHCDPVFVWDHLIFKLFCSIQFFCVHYSGVQSLFNKQFFFWICFFDTAINVVHLQPYDFMIIPVGHWVSVTEDVLGIWAQPVGCLHSLWKPRCFIFFYTGNVFFRIIFLLVISVFFCIKHIIQILFTVLFSFWHRSFLFLFCNSLIIPHILVYCLAPCDIHLILFILFIQVKFPVHIVIL